MKSKVARPCRNCFENKGVGKMTRHSVEYQGVKIPVFRSGEFCSECINKFLEEVKEMIEKFGVNNGLVIAQDGKIKVNWQVYIDAERTAAKERLKHMTRLLGWLKILTWQSGRHSTGWAIEGAAPFYISSLDNSTFPDLHIHQVLNPFDGILDHLFIHQEDAIEYARLKLTDARFGWCVRKYGKTISGKEILGKK